MMKLVYYILFCCACSSIITAQENLPGDLAKISYEKAMLDVQLKNYVKAKPEFEKAIQIGGPFGDLSRLMLLRIETGSLTKNDNLQNQIYKQLEGFENQELIPQAFYASLQILKENGLENECIDLAQEFSLRFPNHELFDDSVLLAAQLLFQQKKYLASLLLIQKILLMPRANSNRYDEALSLRGEIYLSDWPDRSTYRACESLSAAHQAGGDPNQATAGRHLFELHCQGI